MSKHTPGPWSLPHMANNEISCNCAYVLAEPYMGSICTISVSDDKTISEFGNDCPPLEEAQANARLIAAAPDLLSALESAWQWMEGQSDAQSKGGHATFDLMMLREQRDIARAAIDKAKG